MRRNIALLLEMEGFKVVTAENGVTGIATAKKERPDLVLCDVMMPAGGGERFYRSLLRSAPTLAKRVVFFTGGAVTEAARQFLRNQPQPILTKPLDLDQLARVAGQITSTTGGGR